MEKRAWNILYYIWFQQVIKIFVVKPFQSRLFLYMYLCFICFQMMYLSRRLVTSRVDVFTCIWRIQRLSMDDYQAKCEFL